MHRRSLFENGSGVEDNGYPWTCFHRLCRRLHEFHLRLAGSNGIDQYGLIVHFGQPAAGTYRVVFGRHTPDLYGNALILASELGLVFRKLAPGWKVVSAQEAASRINKRGLATEYARMRVEYEQSDILNRDLLRKIGGATGARYVFQPRVSAFTQTMTHRWSIPLFSVRLVETRSSIMRLSLQLWDVETGELLWVSVAEGTMQNEALSQDPVYFEDIARAAMGSLAMDFLNQRTASRYTPVNVFLNNLICDFIPKEEPSDKESLSNSVK